LWRYGIAIATEIQKCPAIRTRDTDTAFHGLSSMSFGVCHQPVGGRVWLVLAAEASWGSAAFGG
jgi:hypothetical protein